MQYVLKSEWQKKEDCCASCGEDFYGSVHHLQCSTLVDNVLSLLHVYVFCQTREMRWFLVKPETLKPNLPYCLGDFHGNLKMF